MQAKEKKEVSREDLADIEKVLKSSAAATLREAKEDLDILRKDVQEHAVVCVSCVFVEVIHFTGRCRRTSCGRRTRRCRTRDSCW